MQRFGLMLLVLVMAGGSARCQQLQQQQQQQREQQERLQQLQPESATFAPNIGFESASISTERPRFEVTPCNLNSPDVNSCIRNMIQSFAPQLKRAGIPEYNMPSIDPYFYPRGIFRYTNVGLQGSLLIRNMYIHGISGLKVNSVQSNFTETGGFLMKLGLEFPQLRADGIFKAVVKFGALALEPKGPFNMTMDNVKSTMLVDGVFESKPSGQRVSLRRLNAIISIGNARLSANGIFSDQDLNKRILALVNENLPEIIRVGIPATRDQWAPVLTAHINKFFANVPIEKFIVQ